MSKLSELGNTLNGKTIPNNKGIYPAFGGNGIINYVNDFNYPEGTIVIGRVGANCGSVNYSKTKCWITDNALAFVTKENIDSYFTYCLLKYINLNKFHIGSSQPLITQSIINNLDVEYPKNYAKQKKIGEIIKIIDSKISNNTKINTELELFAKTIYNYWFLQFDFPNDEGMPYKSSGGKMIWNDELNREIPEGWEVAPIGNLIKNGKGGDWGLSIKSGNYVNKVTCIRGADFPSITGAEFIKAPIRYILDKNTKKILEQGDLIVEISGGSPTQSTGRICYINQYLLKRFNTPIITSNFCKPFNLINDRYLYWFYLMWQSFYENNVFFKYEGKTTGIKNLLFDLCVKDLFVVIPSEKIMIKFNNIVSNYYNKIQSNQSENQKLVELRDFLLPLLMNGQVTFKE